MDFDDFAELLDPFQCQQFAAAMLSVCHGKADWDSDTLQSLSTYLTLLDLPEWVIVPDDFMEEDELKEVQSFWSNLIN